MTLKLEAKVGINLRNFSSFSIPRGGGSLLVIVSAHFERTNLVETVVNFVFSKTTTQDPTKVVKVEKSLAK